MILGLPWLQRYNPHVDWNTMCVEVTRDGRRYHLYPMQKEEINTAKVIDNDKEILFLIATERPPRTATAGPRIEKAERREYVQKIHKWINKNTPGLTRPIGKPADTQPFKIDTGEHEPIRINPRPHSPKDLEIIRKFIEEGLESGIIEESRSEWSMPIVLALKPMQ
jgi:hypothetical protein